MKKKVEGGIIEIFI